MSPDERALRADIESARFQIGVTDNRWSFVGLSWPHLTVTVASILEAAVDCYYFRFDCTKYPNDAPTGSIWSVDVNAPLPADLRPVTRGRAAQIFRTDWPSHAKGTALYHPYDRSAASTHSEWQTKQRRLVWKSTHTIVDLLEELHSILQAGDTVHVR